VLSHIWIECVAKREKKPLLIRDPVSKQALEISAPDDSASKDIGANASDAGAEIKTNADASQKQNAFRNDFARILAKDDSPSNKVPFPIESRRHLFDAFA
jgi:hypothetical protein